MSFCRCYDLLDHHEWLSEWWDNPHRWRYSHGGHVSWSKGRIYPINMYSYIMDYGAHPQFFDHPQVHKILAKKITRDFSISVTATFWDLIAIAHPFSLHSITQHLSDLVFLQVRLRLTLHLESDPSESHCPSFSLINFAIWDLLKHVRWFILQKSLFPFGVVYSFIFLLGIRRCRC